MFCHIRGVPGIPLRDLRDRPQLSQIQLPAIHPHAEHEELILQLVRLQHGRPAAVDTRATLGIQPPPPQPTPQIRRINRREPPMGIDVLHPSPHIQRVVILLDPLIGVQGLPMPQSPLTLTARPPWAGRCRPAGGVGIADGNRHCGVLRVVVCG
jgi:hypothetical protein